MCSTLSRHASASSCQARLPPHYTPRWWKDATRSIHASIASTMEERPDEAGERAAVFTATLVPPTANVAGLEAQVVQAIHNSCAASLPEGAGGYLWHREPPVVSQGGDEHPAGTLQVSMRVQDCVEDEWFMTYILRALTERIPGLCVRVEDEDGEFLLIEAANELPKWVRPENAERRVWICDGMLHLVPLEYTTDEPHDEDLEAYLSEKDAVALVRSKEVTTQAPRAVQDAAFARLANYPAAAAAHQHRTIAVLPWSVAKLIVSHPQLIAEAVHALATRDVVSARAAQNPSLFPITPSDAGEAPAQDVVLLPVKMTRHLYAQLSHDRFFPPKAYGKRWQAAVERYRLYISGDDQKQSSVSDEEARLGRWCDTGAKLTAGLELAWAAKSARGANASQSHTRKDDDAFIHALSNLGYFEGETPHSKRWNELAQEARSMAPSAVDHDDTLSELRSLRQTLHAPPSEQAQAAALPWSDVEQHRTAEDDEAWLSMAPEELDAIAQPGGGAEDNTVDRLGTFMTKMNEFLQGEGDVEGAMFQDDTFDDGEEPEDDSEDDMSESEKARRMDALVEPVPLSEWGAANAEKVAAQQDGKIQSAPVPAPTELQPQQSGTRLQGLSGHEHYEGDSDSEGSLQGDEHDPEDERSDRRRWLELKEEDDDVNMENEMPAFLEFTRKALGLSDEQYAQILDERRGRGGMLFYLSSLCPRDALCRERAHGRCAKRCRGARFSRAASAEREYRLF